MKTYDNEKVIVSLTSYGVRTKYVPFVLFSLFKGTEKSFHPVLTLYKSDVQYLTDDLNLLIQNNMLELIVVDEDLGPHKKYYYVMKKYRETPIITIDDDCVFQPDFIESLLTAYEKHHCVCARRVHAIPEHGVLPYNKWGYCVTDNGISSRRKFHTGVGGVIYPPNVLDVDTIDLDELKSCLYADDIYIKVLENRKNLEIFIVNCVQKHPIEIQVREVKQCALSLQNVFENRNDKYLKIFEKDIFSL